MFPGGAPKVELLPERTIVRTKATKFAEKFDNQKGETANNMEQ